jgi:hypothetical protein
MIKNSNIYECIEAYDVKDIMVQTDFSVHLNDLAHYPTFKSVPTISEVF